MGRREGRFPRPGIRENRLVEHIAVAVIGAGPAGLSLSHELKTLGIEHVVLERGRVAQTWRDRWENFCLVTPNWSMLLPGFPYDMLVRIPDGFMPAGRDRRALRTLCPGLRRTGA